MSELSAIIMGLGNPGEEYAQTRHNVGFMVLKTLERRHHIEDRKGHTQATVHRGTIKGQSVWLLRPKTYMNLSGHAAAWAVQSRQLAPQRLLVVVDDFALPLGRLRLRPNGGPGGHNGLKSLIAELGTQDFPRLRAGIGPCPEGLDSADFVLRRFRTDEQKALNEMLELAADCVECWLTESMDEAMNRFNRGPAPPPLEKQPTPQPGRDSDSP